MILIQKRLNLLHNRFLILIFFGLFIQLGCKSEHSDSGLNRNGHNTKLAVAKIYETFTKKNSWLVKESYDSLQTILHPKLLYGHSNAWIQNFAAITDPTNPDSLDYKSIEVEEVNVDCDGNVGYVFGNAIFKGKIKETQFDMNLSFIETYVKENGTWLLFTRQSTKTPDSVKNEK